MAYPYSTLPTPISDSTTATPTAHAGHHQSVHSALNDILTELATAPRSLTGLHSALLGIKVWSTGSSAYIWSGDGTAPNTNSYTQILFIDPAGTHDPTTSTGGRTNANDLWETGGGGGALTNDSVTNAILANIATARIKGRVTASTGDPEDLTGTQATTLLDTFTSSLKGLTPSSGGGTTNFLRADGTWTAPAGGGTGLLAYKSYNPGTIASVTTSSTTFADVDATNLAVTFTVPASGAVLVRLSGLAAAGVSLGLDWNLREGSSDITGTAFQAVWNTASGINTHITAAVVVTGLTASASKTWKWGHAREGSGTATTFIGGVAGQAVMEVWSA